MSNDEENSGKAFVADLKKDRRFKDIGWADYTDHPHSAKSINRMLDAGAERAKEGQK